MPQLTTKINNSASFLCLKWRHSPKPAVAFSALVFTNGHNNDEQNVVE